MPAHSRSIAPALVFLLGLAIFLHPLQAAQASSNFRSPDLIEAQLTAKGTAQVLLSFHVPDMERLFLESSSQRVNPALKPSAKAVNEAQDKDQILGQALAAGADDILMALKGSQYKLIRRYTFQSVLALEVGADALAILEADPSVTAITPDRQKRLPPTPRTFRAQTNPPASDPTATTLIGAPDAWKQGYTGSGWYVAVIDTGLRASHEYFQDKTILEACFTHSGCIDGTSVKYGPGSSAHPYPQFDGYDHGTHVAGIAVGNNHAAGFSGVAKHADLIAINVYSLSDDKQDISSYTSDEIAALDYVYSLRNTRNIAAVNISSGEGGYNDVTSCNQASLLESQAITRLREAGIPTVAATGNEDLCTGINAPACMTSATSVGATDYVDRMASFSNWSQGMVELFAPGVGIKSSLGSSNTAYASWDGTSMATPMVAGSLAVLRQVFPKADAAFLEGRLKTTGVTVNTTCPSGGSAPRILVGQAVGSGQATRTLEEALDNPMLDFETPGQKTWFGQTARSWYEGEAAQSPVLDPGQSAILETSLDGPGVLEFYWSSDGLAGYDALILEVNGVVLDYISGPTDWTRVQAILTEGEKRIRWIYRKVSNSPAAFGWVDEVSYQWNGDLVFPMEALPAITH